MTMSAGRGKCAALIRARGQDGGERLFIRKSCADALRKAARRVTDGRGDDKFRYFKRKILEHLDGLEKEENADRKDLKKSLIAFEMTSVEKAGYPVGTIRVWKGKKYIKTAPGKWRPKYDAHSRGAKMSIAALKRKADACTSSEDLLRLTLENRARFCDDSGRPLPFVKELSDYVSGRNDAIERGKVMRQDRITKEEAERHNAERDIWQIPTEELHEEKRRLESVAASTSGGLNAAIRRERAKTQLENIETELQLRNGRTPSAKNRAEEVNRIWNSDFERSGTMTKVVRLRKMKDDCDKYLGEGGRDARCLSALGYMKSDELIHLAVMRRIYDSLNPADRPDWFTGNDLVEYQVKMLGDPGDKEAKKKWDELNKITRAYHGDISQARVEEICDKYVKDRDEMLKEPMWRIKQYSSADIGEYTGRDIGIDDFIDNETELRTTVTEEDLGKKFAKIVNQNTARGIFADYRAGRLRPDADGILRETDRTGGRKET